MSVDVVERYRRLDCYMTDYVEHSRTTWRWKWLARLFAGCGAWIVRDDDGHPYYVECRIEPTASTTSSLVPG